MSEEAPPPRKTKAPAKPRTRRVAPKPKPIPKGVPKEIDPEVLAKRALEKKKARTAKLLAYSKRDAKMAERRLKALQAAEAGLYGEGAVVTEDQLAELPPSTPVDDDKIIFRPNPGPQTLFLAATEKEVFFGGSRGGGKSQAMIVDPLRYCGSENYRALIIRKTMPELRDMIAKAQRLYPKAYPGVKWREQDKLFVFPSGARIEFGYCESTLDVNRYIGQSFTAIYIDELCHYPTPEVLNYLRSSLRSTDPSLPTYIRATGNPGNVGSGWVREMFITPAPPGERFEVVVEAQTARGTIREVITRRFIPSTVWDNPHLLHDNSYVAMLASLPDIQRRQFLEGDWDAFDDAAFSEFRRDTHVIDPFEIPATWQRFRGADWGFRSPACCLWLAIDPAFGTLYAYRELYVTGLTADKFAEQVIQMEAGEQVRYGVLDSSAWANRGEQGPSIAETMIRAGCRWRPADRSPRSRVNGKMELHRRLAIDPETDRPGLMIFSNCVNLIRTLPVLPLDKNNQEDVDTDAEDHAYDALRYACSSRPVAVESPWDLRDVARRPGFQAADDNFGY